MSNSYDPYSSYPSSSKDTSGADHDFDFDHLLNLPPFSPPSSAESPLVSSPENSDHSRHFSPEYDFNSDRNSPAEHEQALSWEGILRGPVWPETNGEASNSISTSSTTSFSPPTPLNHHLPSPSPHPAAPPSTLPSFFFPTTIPAPSPAPPTPAPAPQPSNALLDALMAYNTRYGTILPPSTNVPSSIPAESTMTAASAHGDDEHEEEEEEEAHSSAGAGGDHDEEEDEDSMAYRDLFGTSYQATGGEAGGPSSSTSYLGGSLVGPRRTMGGQVMSSVVVEEGEERMEGDEWRPTPEEYKKLSSKEKRQLRNKISARNFRVRRKNQISTLESRLNDRERIIGAVRDELGSARMENAELRREIQALKNAVFGSTQTPTFNSTTISPAQLEAPNAVASTSSLLPKVNRSKDVSAASTKGFWAGQNSSPFGGGPFNTSVHAFTTPDLIFPSSASLAGKQQPNLNPLFNSGGGMGGGFFSPPNYKPSLPTATSQEGTFDEFVQATPYTLRHATVEAYRNQLWTRLAREAAYAKSSSSTTNGADALASGLRPKFYTSPSTNSNSFLTGSGSNLLPGSSTSSHHSPSMSTPTPSPITTTPTPSSSEDTSHLAFLAHVATQSITSRLSAAFVEAFTTPGPSFTSLGSTKSSSTTNPPTRSLDAEKIASVLSGKSVVQIVPVASTSPAPQASTPSSSSSTESALERALAGLSLSSSSAPTPSSAGHCAVGGLKNLLGCVGGRACHSGRPSVE